MSDSLLIQEITDLRARLAASEAEKSLAAGALAICREQRDATEDALRTAYEDVDAWKEAEFRAQAKLREEKRKREEAERVHGELVAGIQEAISDWATENERGEKYLCAPGLLLIEALLPSQEKKSQEKP